ncbi:UNC93 protein MFSD11 [Trichostrongylus colubriformis]|uniref:UNC93 protein MFSD11 n=1 Tax=Trichostrongylus colubriformis TaxID=6319 RepID=A0AAN8FPV4_TRICO
MQLSPRRHELLSIYMMGFGTLFLYLGYHTQSFISESIIHSVHSRDPQRISGYAGYYGQAIHYSAFAVSCLFTASLQHYLASKWMLVLATVFFAVYHLGFLYINSYYFYASQILMGIAASLYNNGEGAYLAEHSSRRTVESNSGIETAVGHTSMLVGGIALLLVFNIIPADISEKTTHFRSFSENHIQAIYGTLFGLSLISTIIFALLPTKQYDSIASNSPRIIPSFKDQLKGLAKTSIHPNMILLTFTFLHMGLLVSFFLGIYPTTLSFTASLSQDVYIVALYSCSAGLAEVSSGIFVRPLIKKCRSYKLIVTVALHFGTVIAALTLFQLSVPERSTIEPTHDNALWFTPSRILACTFGFLVGMADFTLTMARAVICQKAVPHHRIEVFSLTRIHQCIASCIVLILSPYMTVTIWTIVLSTSLLIGCTCFVIVIRRTNDTDDNVSPVDRVDSKEKVSVSCVA